MTGVSLKRAVNTKYKFGSSERLHCPNNIKTDFVTKFKQILEMLRKTDAAVATSEPPSGDFSTTSQSLVCVVGGHQAKLLPGNTTGQLRASSTHQSWVVGG